jgi:hypothetical protein
MAIQDNAGLGEFVQVRRVNLAVAKAEVVPA